MFDVERTRQDYADLIRRNFAIGQGETWQIGQVILHLHKHYRTSWARIAELTGISQYRLKKARDVYLNGKVA